MRSLILASAVTMLAADGAPEWNDAASFIASLACTPDATVSSALSLTQVAALEVTVHYQSTGAEPIAMYVTDTDDTVLWMVRDASEATPTISSDIMSDAGQRLIPHALVRGAGGRCTDLRGKATETWQTRVDHFDYTAAGGAHAGMHSEEMLRQAAPTLSVDVNGGVVVSMPRWPALYVPLLYVKCQSTAVVALYTFERDRWPAAAAAHGAAAGGAADASAAMMAHAPPAATFSAAIDVPTDDSGCLQLHACAAMPAQEACGGFPQRCTQLDRTADLVARLEAKGRRPFASLPRASLSAAVASRGVQQLTMRVHASPCVGAASASAAAADGASAGDMVLAYVRDAEGRVVAIGDGDLQFQISRQNATARGAPLTAYRVCGARGASPEVGVLTIDPSSLLADFERSQAARHAKEAAQAAAAAAGPRASSETPPRPQPQRQRLSPRSAAPGLSTSPAAVGVLLGQMLLAAVALGAAAALIVRRRRVVGWGESKAAERSARVAAEGAPLTAFKEDADGEGLDEPPPASSRV